MVETSQIYETKQNDAGDENKSEGSDPAHYDNKKTATNVSIFLSLTAASSLISSYFGGKLLEYFTVRQIFLLSTIFPLFTLAASFITYEFKA